MCGTDLALSYWLQHVNMLTLYPSVSQFNHACDSNVEKVREERNISSVTSRNVEGRGTIHKVWIYGTGCFGEKTESAGVVGFYLHSFEVSSRGSRCRKRQKRRESLPF